MARGAVTLAQDFVVMLEDHAVTLLPYAIKRCIAGKTTKHLPVIIRSSPGLEMMVFFSWHSR